MALVLIILLAGLGAGFAARGSLRNFERLQIHWWGVAIVGLGLQAIPVPVRFGADSTVLRSFFFGSVSPQDSYQS